MTLEQIKNRQGQLNELVYALLNDTQAVVEKIVGVQPEKDREASLSIPISGLIDELHVGQNTTEDYIRQIHYFNTLLANNVYEPQEASIGTSYNQNKQYDN